VSAFTESSTRLLLLLNVLFLVGWDILAIRFGGGDASISQVTFQFARDHPMVAVAVGVVVGHIFWRD
jgi:hypothetical protein